MKRIYLHVSIAGAMLMAGAANADLDLAKQSGCLSCHSVERKLLGPAWNDVSEKYQGDAGAHQTLVNSIKKGSRGKWGGAAMPPQTRVSDENVGKLADFILGLKK